MRWLDEDTGSMGWSLREPGVMLDARRPGCAGDSVWGLRVGQLSD